MATTIYSPQEFFTRSDTEAPLTLTGMVKKEEAGDQFVSFVVGTTCDNWRKVPNEAIEGIEYLRDVACADHNHPLVNVTFHKPKTDEGQLFAALASDMKVEARRIIIKVSNASAGDGGGGRAPNIDAASCHTCLNYCGTVDMDQFFQCASFCMSTMCP